LAARHLRSSERLVAFLAGFVAFGAGGMALVVGPEVQARDRQAVDDEHDRDDEQHQAASASSAR
jgi:hypothetical protein